jgi:addiction module HigA family antidote
LDFLPDYRLTAEQLAAALLLPLGDIEAVLEERASIDADLALRLARFFGSSPEMWMALQREVDFFDVLATDGTSIDAIVPVDPATSACAQDREPLPEDFVQELREQIADLDDDTRWVICSAFLEDELDDDSLWTTYYEVGSDCWAVGIEHGTAFKREWAAQAVAAGLREGVRVVSTNTERLERTIREEATDTAARKRYLRRSRDSLRFWQWNEILRSEEDITAYLEMAAEEREPELLSGAVHDVLAILRARCQGSEVAQPNRPLRPVPASYDAVLSKVRDIETDPGDEL